jgi:hypothetical protein
MKVSVANVVAGQRFGPECSYSSGRGQGIIRVSAAWNYRAIAGRYLRVGSSVRSTRSNYNWSWRYIYIFLLPLDSTCLLLLFGWSWYRSSRYRPCPNYPAWAHSGRGNHIVWARLPYTRQLRTRFDHGRRVTEMVWGSIVERRRNYSLGDRSWSVLLCSLASQFTQATYQ